MLIIVYILFCIGVLIGVACIIIYLSSLRKKDEAQVNTAIQKRGATEMVKYKYDNFDLPHELSEEYIERKWRELQSNTNMLNKWWTALEARFHTRQQVSFIEAQRRKLEVAEKFARAKANAYIAGKEARDAETDFNVAGRKDYQDSRAKREIISVKADIAEYEAKIAEAKRRKKGPPEEKPPEPEKGARRPKMTREAWRQKMVNDLNTSIDDEMAVHGAINEKLAELERNRRQWEEDIVGDQNLSQKEVEQRLQDIEAVYINLRKKILTAKPRGRT